MIRIPRAALSSRVLCVYIGSYALSFFFSHASHLPCRSFKPVLLISFSQPILSFISIVVILAWSHGTKDKERTEPGERKEQNQGEEQNKSDLINTPK